MANVQNSFIKSKLNRDLDARLIPNGEYREAFNVQVSKSEGPNVGSLENVLGNKILKELEFITGNDSLVCIGHLVDESKGEVYLFLTDYTDPSPNNITYNKNTENYITVYNAANDTLTFLVGGPAGQNGGNWLNFSTTNEIHHANLLEDLLFWTDNRNQPRKINTVTAKSNTSYYTNEDQISVAKYNPFEPIEFWQESSLGGSGEYETTMKNVTDKTLPNGSTGFTTSAGGSGNITVTSLTGDLPRNDNPGNGNSGQQYGGAQAAYINPSGDIVLINNGDAFVYQVNFTAQQTWVISLRDAANNPVNWPALGSGTKEVVFNPNPYYDKNFAGDPAYLEDRFVRFSYRFKFDDNEYSIFAPFTQIAFIPKQDGYFMYVKKEKGIQLKDDQTAAYRSTIVEFMENKVDDIKLRIPLPYTKTTLQDSLKIKELEILYKESDGLAIKVVDTIPVTDIAAQSPNDQMFIYDYLSKKPTKTLPSDEITRVYDKIPVKAFAQEVSGNRVIYGNFQNKHTPPEFLDYNVGVSTKSDFDLKTGSASTTQSGTVNAGTNITITNPTGTIIVGSYVTSSTVGVTIPANTQITETTGTPVTQIKLSNNVTLVNPTNFVFTPFGENTESTSIIEYPNHTVKQNRTYQVGVVLSDRYGRQSSVILSNNKNLVTAEGNTFQGDTIYAPYIDENITQETWPGNSLKVLFNSVVSSPRNIPLGIPGLYNGDRTSDDYNPLGWYSYKIVVKQTQQEYYNVYLPGIMASYPEDTTLEINKTSHAVLINDNINKVPRDLNEVGPDQKQFRSSVQLFGRVENTNLTDPTAYGTEDNLLNPALMNDQYYPGRVSHTVSTISTLQDLFDYNPIDPPRPNYVPQFYLSESNPLIARISTDKKIGQVSTLNYAVSAAQVALQQGTEEQSFTAGQNIPLKNTSGSPVLTDVVTGANIPEDAIAQAGTSTTNLVLNKDVTLTKNTYLYFVPAFPSPNDGKLKTPGIQYLAVYETEPVESALDIFWETTSTGIISTLNNLILNSVGGAGGLSTLNSSNWDEAHVLNENIFNATFTLVDSFGSDIPPSNITSLTLSSVTNSQVPTPLNVQDPSVGPYFELYKPDPAGSPGEYNIRLLQDYIDNVFFSTNSEVREFNFTLSAEITSSGGDVSTSTFNIGPIGPSNVAPSLSIAAATPSNANDFTNDITSSIGNNPTINSNRYVPNVITFVGVNGSSSNSLRTQDFDWSIQSITMPNSNNPSQDISANGANLGYFVLSNTTRPSNAQDYPSQKQSIITIPPTSLGQIPASLYQFTVRGIDAGGTPQMLEYRFKLDLTITPSNDSRAIEYICVPEGEQGGGYDTYNWIELRITTGTVNQNGWYLFDVPSLSSLDTQQNGNGTITINRTSAITNSPSSCPSSSTIPFFAGGTTSATVRANYVNSDCTDCPNYQPGSVSDSDTIDFTGYTFEII